MMKFCIVKKVVSFNSPGGSCWQIKYLCGNRKPNPHRRILHPNRSKLCRICFQFFYQGFTRLKFDWSVLSFAPEMAVRYSKVGYWSRTRKFANFKTFRLGSCLFSVFKRQHPNRWIMDFVRKWSIQKNR